MHEIFAGIDIERTALMTVGEKPIENDIT
jgi:hypothetical protein